MRRIIKACLLISISVTGLIVAAPGWSASDGDARETLDILIERLQGKVDVSTDGAASRVAIGDALALPSRIVTSEDGNIDLSQGRTLVRIAPDSDVEIPEAAAEGQLIARMIQHRGSAFYDVETRPLEQLKLTVETPYLVAVVKGTQFNVAVVNDTTTISLYEGTLEIRTPDGLESIQLNAGEIAIRSLTDDTIRRLPMDFDRIAQADDRDAAGAAAGSAARDSWTATASNDVVVVGGGNASVPTGGAVDDTSVRVAAAVSPSGDEAGKIGGEVEVSGSPSLAVSADVEVGSTVDARVATSVDTNVSVGSGTVDLGVGVDTGVDLGGGGVDVGLDAGIDTGVSLDGGSVDVGLDAGLDTGVDLGGGSVDLGLDTRLDPGVDLGDGSVDLGLDAGLDAGLDLGVDLGLDSAGLDLGLGGSGATGGAGTSGGGSVGGTDQSGGGLLGGLLGPLL